MSEHPYTSRVHVTRSAGPDRLAVLPTGETVTFGVHGGIAAHYGIEAKEDRAATLDYVVAATAAAMVGTLARTLRDEGIVVGEGAVMGTITERPRGLSGFGWDPTFVPDGAGGLTFAEMDDDAKNAISHRRKAFLALRDALDPR